MIPRTGVLGAAAPGSLVLGAPLIWGGFTPSVEHAYGAVSAAVPLGGLSAAVPLGLLSAAVPGSSLSAAGARSSIAAATPQGRVE